MTKNIIHLNPIIFVFKIIIFWNFPFRNTQLIITLSNYRRCYFNGPQCISSLDIHKLCVLSIYTFLYAYMPDVMVIIKRHPNLGHIYMYWPYIQFSVYRKISVGLHIYCKCLDDWHCPKEGKFIIYLSISIERNTLSLLMHV